MTASVKSSREREVDPRNLKKSGVEVGVLVGESTGQGAASMAEIAVWNEFGTERTVEIKGGGGTKRVQWAPARPFMRSTIARQKKAWAKTVERVNRLILNGTISEAQARAIVGAQMQGDIQQRIVDLRTPPNAESTIKRKGSDSPLVDTGALGDAIKWADYDG